MEGLEEIGLQLDFRLLLLQAVGFLIIYWLLKKFLFGPVTGLLRSREDEIAQNLSQAEAEKKQALQLRSDLEGQLASITQEAKRRMDQAIAEAGEVRAKLLAEAQEQSQQMLSRAREELQREKKRALLELRQEVADLAIMAASKALQSELDETIRRQAVDDFISQMEEKSC